MTAPTLTVAQTLPRTHRCDATVAQAPGDFGFVPVTCRQSVGVATFVTTAGLRVGYCAREGHQASVRRRFAERVESVRHFRIEGCSSCVGSPTGAVPPHDASSRCESGRRPHCSCDGCF